jgi:hypothetical protein
MNFQILVKPLTCIRKSKLNMQGGGRNVIPRENIANILLIKIINRQNTTSYTTP